MHKNLLFIVLIMSVLIAGCSGGGHFNEINSQNPGPASEASTPTATPTLTETPVEATATPSELPTSITSEITPACNPAPIVVPTAAAYPGTYMLDESTNLHMTGHAVMVDVESYRLKITGLVDRPLSISYDALRCMPKITATPDLVCSGFFVDRANWTGVPLKYILDLAGVKSGAKTITLVAADKYETRVNLQIALQEKNFLAYEWQGEPLPILHGFPLRAVFPDLSGNEWVKWLLEIRVE